MTSSFPTVQACWTCYLPQSKCNGTQLTSTPKGNKNQSELAEIRVKGWCLISTIKQ